MSDTAGISSRAALSTSAGIRHAPSRIEYSEWTCRWTNGELIGRPSYWPRWTAPVRAGRHEVDHSRPSKRLQLVRPGDDPASRTTRNVLPSAHQPATSSARMAPPLTAARPCRRHRSSTGLTRGLTRTSTRGTPSSPVSTSWSSVGLPPKRAGSVRSTSSSSSVWRMLTPYGGFSSDANRGASTMPRRSAGSRPHRGTDVVRRARRSPTTRLPPRGRAHRRRSAEPQSEQIVRRSRPSSVRLPGARPPPPRAPPRAPRAGRGRAPAAARRSPPASSISPPSSCA